MKEQTQIEAVKLYISQNLSEAVKLILMAHKKQNPVRNLEEAAYRIGLEIKKYAPDYFSGKHIETNTPNEAVIES